MTSSRSRNQRQQPPPSQTFPTKEMKVLGAFVAVITVVAIGFALFRSSSAPAAPGSSTTASGNASRMIRDDSPQDGPRDAQVTLVEFLDPECESCGAMYPIVERIRRDYAGRIRFVVRYYPLHNNSVLAAKAMEAAGRQQKYWEMYALVFQNQNAWGEQTTPQTEIFVRFAQQLGLNMETFQRDLRDSALDAKVERDRSDGLALGVKGTPTFFLNGAVMGSMMTYEQMKSRIEAGLK